MTDGSKRQRLQRKLDEHGFVPSRRYEDREGETLSTFYGEARRSDGPSPQKILSLSGTFYRVSAQGLPVQPGTPALAEGRFHLRGEPIPLYVSSSREVALSEVAKHMVLVQHELPVEWCVTTVRVEPLRVVEIAPESTRRAWTRTEEAAARDVDGLLIRDHDARSLMLVVFPHALDRVSFGESEVVGVDAFERCAAPVQEATVAPELEPDYEQILALLSGSYV